jgi:hypothetical protein
MTYEEHRDAAYTWRDAPNRRVQAKIHKEKGVRWSELMRLPYFDPTWFIVVDGMHNLFLGLIRHHFRIILGMDIPVSPEDEEDDGEGPRPERPPTDAEMKTARKIMASPNCMQLKRLRIPVLRELCNENAMDDIPHTTKYPRKMDFITVLLVSD